MARAVLAKCVRVPEPLDGPLALHPQPDDMAAGPARKHVVPRTMAAATEVPKPIAAPAKMPSARPVPERVAVGAVAATSASFGRRTSRVAALSRRLVIPQARSALDSYRLPRVVGLAGAVQSAVGSQTASGLRSDDSAMAVAAAVGASASVPQPVSAADASAHAASEGASAAESAGAPAEPTDKQGLAHRRLAADELESSRCQFSAAAARAEVVSSALQWTQARAGARPACDPLSSARLCPDWALSRLQAHPNPLFCV